MTRKLILGWLLSVLATSTVLAGGEPVVVSIRDFKFDPPELTVPSGTTVRWENVEKRQYHSVWFEALGDPEPDYLFPGDAYERLFDRPGEYPYRCGPHPEMTGMVRVTE